MLVTYGLSSFPREGYKIFDQKHTIMNYPIFDSSLRYVNSQNAKIFSEYTETLNRVELGTSRDISVMKTESNRNPCNENWIPVMIIG